jgi:pre-mRNA cleavage complex 2 protein Pcf11
MYGAPYNAHAPAPQYGAAPPMPGYYGAPAPAQPMYGQPAPPQQPYYAHGPPALAPAAPAPPAHLSSPDAFAAYFHSQLATLTFNSKPIITNLTIIAHENIGAMGNVVAQCVDEHISQVRQSDAIPSDNC